MKAGLMLAVNPNATREENDFYATDPYAIDKVAEELNAIGVCNSIWECACGKGHLSKRLEEYGYSVLSTDLVDRGYGTVENFLLSKREWHGDILTNPPFKYASNFVTQAMRLLDTGRFCVLFLKVQFLETPARKNLFKKCGLRYVIVNSERICCAKDGNFDAYFKQGSNGGYKGGTQLYCWFVFQKGYNGEPTIRFV